MKTSNIFILVIIIIFLSCNKNDNPLPEGLDFRQEMRNFVIDLSTYSKNINSDFIIIPQNGQELITNNGEGNGTLQTTYIQSIDATGRESMFYGYYKDDQITPDEDKQHLLDLCIVCENNNVEVLTTDYCSTESKMDDSYEINNQNNFISFAAPERNLDVIPTYPTPIYNENSDDITQISEAKNFLYIINGDNYATKEAFVNAISATNYDALVIDLYHNEDIFTPADITQLKTKQNGGQRLVICYMSIGEAEDYRYYWQQEWSKDKPTWLEPENPNWKGNYKVRYWETEWQNIIFGNDNSYLKKILDAGFDGVYLDIIDGFEYFEEEY